MRKSMQNGTLKRRVGARGVSPLSSTQSPYLVLVSQYYLTQCAVDSYIRPQPQITKRPYGTATRMRGRIYGLPPLPPTSDFVLICY